jgi:hypothetical protein
MQKKELDVVPFDSHYGAVIEHIDPRSVQPHIGVKEIVADARRQTKERLPIGLSWRDCYASENRGMKSFFVSFPLHRLENSRQAN